MKRLLHSIWLRLTFQLRFDHKKDDYLTELIRDILNTGIKGYIRIEGNINILLEDQRVVSIKDSIKKHSKMFFI